MKSKRSWPVSSSASYPPADLYFIQCNLYLHLPATIHTAKKQLVTMAAFGHEALLLQLYHHAVVPREVPGREDKTPH
jgi:hypothetical protein